MKKQVIKQFFEFLEKKEKIESPLLYKLVVSPETLTEKDLTVEGDLDLWGIDIKSLPKGLKVGRDLILEDCILEYLPKGLVVGRSLYLINAASLKKLPDNLTVGGSLHLDYTYVEDVPINLKVGRNLHVGFSKLLRNYGEDLKKEIERNGGYVEGEVWGRQDEESTEY